MSRAAFTKTGKRREPLPSTPESLAAEWWRAEGVYIDPSPEDDDWYDKRSDLAALAFEAGYKKAMETRRGGRS